MRYRKLTSDGDYSFGAGQLDFYRDVPEAVGQAVQTRLLLWLGEWFLNTDEGTPYMLGILGKHSKEVADITIQDRIEGTEGFVSLDDYESTLDGDTRALEVSTTINTIYGPTVVQVENYRNY